MNTTNNQVSNTNTEHDTPLRPNHFLAAIPPFTLADLSCTSADHDLAVINELNKCIIAWRDGHEAIDIITITGSPF
jgi:hypothetical protein